MDSQEKLIKATNKLIDYLRHLAVEFQVTEDELRQVVNFLTQVGQHNEFQLLSDVLGISVLVDDITYGHEENGTVHNVEGPLYRPDAPLRTPPVKLTDDNEGDILFMSGQVLAAEDQRPLPHATLDVWQTNEQGYYENQDEHQADYNLRGRLRTEERGRFEFQTVLPGAYEVTRGGPVGEFLKVLGRHAWRPAHIHFKVTCQGFAPLTTMLFMPNDPWLNSDAINAVKESLIVKLEKHESLEDMQQRGLDQPYYTCQYNFVLKTAKLSEVGH